VTAGDRPKPLGRVLDSGTPAVLYYWGCLQPGLEDRVTNILRYAKFIVALLIPVAIAFEHAVGVNGQFDPNGISAIVTAIFGALVVLAVPNAKSTSTLLK
jgi:hypothetical protein